MKITIPLRTVSEANMREHFMTVSRRKKQQREAVAMHLRMHGVGRGPAIVTLTRIGKRKLDDDNLKAALKATRDGIADALAANGCIRQVKQGKHRLAGDDSDPRVEWRYQQRRGFDYCVEVEIGERGEA